MKRFGEWGIGSKSEQDVLFLDIVPGGTAEFQLLEVTRHTPITDKLVLHYFELPKLPATDDREDEQKLWLALFKAETEEQLEAIEAMEVPIMEQAIRAYRHITATDEFQEIERLRDRARRNEASALGYARREGRAEGEQAERKKWQGVVADKDTALAEQSVLIADKDALIAELRSRLGEDK